MARDNKQNPGNGGDPVLPEIGVSGGSDLTIQNGASASLQFLINQARIPSITLSISGTPNDVTAVFTPSGLPHPAPSQNVTLKLTATSTALASNSTLHVIAKSGTHIGSQTFKLTVVSPFSFVTGAPVLSIGVKGEWVETSSTPVKLAAFGRITLPLNLQIASGVGGTISLVVVTALPSGIGAQFTPSSLATPAAGGSMVVQLTLTAGGNVVPGTVALTVVARIGAADKSTLTFPLVIVPPFVSGISPTVGAVPMFRRSGTAVTISGGGFGPGASVSFGVDAPVLAASVASDGTSLVAIVPRTAASGPLTVNSPAGTSLGPVFSVDNYRNTRAYSFFNSFAQNVVGPTFTSTEVAALFGLGGNAFAGPFLELFAGAVDVMLDAHGLCFGMCQTSLRFDAGQLTPAAFPQLGASAGIAGPAGPDVWTLVGPRPGPTGNLVNGSPVLLEFIHQQHMAQFSQEGIGHWVGFHASVTTGSELRAAILSGFSAGSQSGIGTMVALSPSLGDGHVVVAYDLIDTGSGNFDVLVYNPNEPFATTEDMDSITRNPARTKSVIHVTSTGSWTFPDFGGWSGSIWGITVIPWNTVPLVPTYPFPEVFAVLGTAGALFGIFGGLAGFAGALVGVLIAFVTGDAEITQINDAQGHTLLSDGRINADPKTKLSGIRPMPALGGLGKKSVPVFVGKGHDALSHVITGKNNGTYSMTWMGQGIIATLADIQTTPGASDAISIEKGKIKLAVSAGKSVKLKILGVGTSSRLPRMATLSTNVSAKGTIQFAFDPQAETFEYTHSGKATDYRVEFSSLDANGKVTTRSTRSASVGNGTTTTLRPPWDKLRKGTLATSVPSDSGKMKQRKVK
jgi:hypothetical protein